MRRRLWNLSLRLWLRERFVARRLCQRRDVNIDAGRDASRQGAQQGDSHHNAQLGPDRARFLRLAMAQPGESCRIISGIQGRPRTLHDQ